MDLSAVKTEPYGLSKEERSRRFELNLCLYCGGEGHRAKTCTAKKPKKD
jgi:hypothetical protein